MEGFLCIDKPVGPSSFAVTSAVRKKLGLKKTGHVGTLDPLASGLLVIALGDSTRLIQYLPSDPKKYEFTVHFGIVTDTLDAEGEITETCEVYPGKEQIEGVLDRFKGEQQQLPPLYSAVKIAGTPAYKLARRGKEVEMKERSVRIDSLKLTGFDKKNHTADFSLTCSSGTYVRSLARDIAEELNSLGHIVRLRRTAVGVFSLKDAVDFKDLDHARNYIIKTRNLFREDEKVTLEDHDRDCLFFGKDIELSQSEKKLIVAFDREGNLVSVLRRVEGGRYHPEKVFHKKKQ
ncbi:MAG: tRNA pseudouridine(55) synthase TruB [Chitinispirillaceae bacterium]